MLATHEYQPRALGSKYNEARMEKKIRKGGGKQESHFGLRCQVSPLALLSLGPAHHSFLLAHSRAHGLLGLTGAAARPAPLSSLRPARARTAKRPSKIGLAAPCGRPSHPLLAQPAQDALHALPEP